MANNKSASFILTLPLITEPWQEHRINKTFKIACKIYNSLVRQVSCKYKQIIKTKRYRKTLNNFINATKKDKIKYLKELQQIQYDFGLTKYQIEALAMPYQHYYSKNINSHIAQKIAMRVYVSFSKLMFSNGKRMHYCKYDDFTSIEGKNNLTGIKFLSNKIFFNKMILLPKINHSDNYVEQALSNRIKYCRLKREFIRGKWKFYI